MATLSNTDLTVADANITTLKDGSGNNPSTPAEINSGRAKCWVCFQGNSTAAIDEAFNMDSLSDTGTGTYTCNVITDFGSENYVAVGAVCQSSRGVVSFDSLTSGVITITTREGHTGTASDYGKVVCAAFGDQ